MSTGIRPLAIVTGASTGVGYELAKRCAEAGFDLVVAADDGNQVLAASPGVASLLGWEPADLVGRRVTVLIPTDMRVAHVTGFTRYLVTGRTSIIGHDVAVPALHRDGHHVPVTLHVERLAAGDRVVFVARMTAHEQEAAG